MKDARRCFMPVLLSAVLGCVPVPGTKTVAKKTASPSPSKVGVAASPSSSKAGRVPDSARKGLEQSLLLLAKLSFASNKAQIVSNNGGTIISNNGGTIISNNGGNLGGKQYRTQGIEKTISAEALPGETLSYKKNWVDGWISKRFYTNANNFRDVLIHPNGRAVQEEKRSNVTYWPNGNFQENDYQKIDLFADGGFGIYQASHTSYGEKGDILQMAFSALAFEDQESGVEIEAERLNIDAANKRGDFVLNFKHLNVREKGELSGIEGNLANQISINMFDPLSSYTGSSQVETTAGELLFSKEQLVSKGLPSRVYKFPNGMQIVFTWDSERREFSGHLLQEGLELGKVRMEQAQDGGTTFVVTLDEDPDHPITVGFGSKGAVGTGAPAPEIDLPETLWLVTTFAGGKSAGFIDGPTQSDVRLGLPVGLAVVGNYLYVVDAQNHCIQRIEFREKPDGYDFVSMKTIAGNGTAGYRDGQGAQALFNVPFGIVAGRDGTLYVTETAGHRVRKIAMDGTVSTLAGTGKLGFLDGSGVEASFNGPCGLALDDQDNLLVADAGNHAIRKITPGGIVSTLAGTGSPGYADGQGTGVKFKNPFGMVRGADGAFYVSDQGNFRIRKLLPDGTVSTFVGSGVSGAIDGKGQAAQLVSPHGLAVDASGNLYVTDFGIRQIMRIATDGEVMTMAGSGVTDASFDGSIRQAGFLGPGAVAFEPKGLGCFVADTMGHRIRVVRPYALIDLISSIPGLPTPMPTQGIPSPQPSYLLPPSSAVPYSTPEPSTSPF